MVRADWNNGRRYYEYADKVLAKVPDDEALRPSSEALAWHREHRFLRAG